jgi:hypothetical protein
MNVARSLVVWLALLALLAPEPLSAQAPVLWLGGHPEARPDGCVWYVARWSDGSSTATPWDCTVAAEPARPDGVVGADRGYPEARAEGCVWYVTRWSDGGYSAVPFSCPAGVTATKAGSAIASAAPPASPTPELRDGLRFYPLGGTLTIDDISPPVGSEIAANGRIFISYRHHATGLPEGWRMGYRIWGTYVTRDGRECRDCYLADGLQGSPRFYQPGPSTATWTGPPEAIHTYRRIQICFTILNPETNEARWTSVCDERSANP